MKTLFKVLFWGLVIFSALSIDNASMELVMIEAVLLVPLAFLAFCYDEIFNRLNEKR